MVKKGCRGDDFVGAVIHKEAEVSEVSRLLSDIVYHKTFATSTILAGIVEIEAVHF